MSQQPSPDSGKPGLSLTQKAIAAIGENPLVDGGDRNISLKEKLHVGLLQLDPATVEREYPGRFSKLEPADIETLIARHPADNPFAAKLVPFVRKAIDEVYNSGRKFEHPIDSDAVVRARARHERWIRTVFALDAFVFVLVLFGAPSLLLINIDAVPKDWRAPLEWLSAAPLLLLTVMMVLTMVLGFLVEKLGLGERWVETRTEREQQRIALFRTTIADVGSASHPEPELQALTLEYFRRYQLDVQKAYFDQRSRELRGKLRRQHILSTASRIAIGVTVIGWGLLWCAVGSESGGRPALPSLDSWLIWIESWNGEIVLSLPVAFAFLAYASSKFQAAFRTTGKDAQRYADTLRDLLDVEASSLKAARRAAAEGDWSKVEAFIDEIQKIIQGEHRVWKILR